MIKDFETVKKQLQELSTVINNFKSEAVQLRILELLFKGVRVIDDKEASDDEKHGDEKVTPYSRKARKKKEKKESSNGSQKKSTQRSGKLGPVSALNQLVTDDFFKTKRTIGDIVEHCKNNLATPIKSNDISGKLASLVRTKILKRIRNTETNQYEYTKV